MLALLTLLLAPAAAARTRDAAEDQPRAGAKLDKPPAQVRLPFDETSRRASARCGCSTPRARRSRRATHSTRTARAREIAVKLKPGLGDGTYTATYHVISADGHPVSSGFVFTVGDAAAPSQSLDQLLASSSKAGRITNSALSVARGVQYAAIALGLGALIFFFACWRPARSPRGRSPRGWSA